MTAMDKVNALGPEAFIDAFGTLYEHSPWVAEGAASARPFSDAEAMIAAMNDVVAQAGEAAQRALVRAHPELARRVGVDPDLTQASREEQRSAGLDRLLPEEFARFSALNAAYREKFDMPFVICVRLTDKAGILVAMEHRLTLSPVQELHTALEQIGHIAGLRLKDHLSTVGV
ncbi:hypothetical protein AA103196_1659 [Ameyamaea chiangmaiensis NBRC 103196]|uniref:2-oxo-4-hydroxy-4-carboxy-5-ureidoimidazoline decarboxylase n=1 Tax=Ameyamaea chiangmaiensis TaxID=442969 RepID=A0A850PCS5_9PROT|nr:2-oxo-4-hydroxy-4-carboxy-5-ureidoimidazoline decarboxylase [Ameyamaea chiangmaiensis]MBS4074075.1 2-oxo-4-hydroxy-4-carboxy-5-ureidoimidazoline decarboxylase [Ameyamaea chiangmaiensis]NVN40449.1 2-oxo-4-hydroxy-4-carboxy-5-ureidoimidazoline decarboxylase [Ameyamaea chiangmaiensis]GBQ67339.1 hypothetical protein AA103196_1659 [Ameyamaea chiangmaiensis NBRC 103196]